jgi:hypothetical protein
MDSTLKALNWVFLDKPSIGWSSGRENLKKTQAHVAVVGHYTTGPFSVSVAAPKTAFCV